MTFHTSPAGYSWVTGIPLCTDSPHFAIPPSQCPVLSMSCILCDRILLCTGRGRQPHGSDRRSRLTMDQHYYSSQGFSVKYVDVVVAAASLVYEQDNVPELRPARQGLKVAQKIPVKGFAEAFQELQCRPGGPNKTCPKSHAHTHP